jgi:hypothetical protein
LPFDEFKNKKVLEDNIETNEKKRKIKDISVEYKKADNLMMTEIIHVYRRIENEISLIPETQIFDTVRNYILLLKSDNIFPLVMALNLIACRRDKRGAYILSMISLRDGPVHFFNTNILKHCLRDWVSFDDSTIGSRLSYQNMIDSMINTSAEIDQRNKIEIEFLLRIKNVDEICVPNTLSRTVYAIDYTFQKVSYSEENKFSVDKLEINDVLGHYSFCFASPILSYVFTWSLEQLITAHEFINLVPLARLAVSCIELSLLLHCSIQCIFLAESFGPAQYLLCVTNLWRLTDSKLSILVEVIFCLYHSSERCLKSQNEIESFLSQSFILSAALLSSVACLFENVTRDIISNDRSVIMNLNLGYLKRHISKLWTQINSNPRNVDEINTNTCNIFLALTDDTLITSWKSVDILFHRDFAVERDHVKPVHIDVNLSSDNTDFFYSNGIFIIPSIFKLLPQVCNQNNCSNSDNMCRSSIDSFSHKLRLLCEKWFIPIIYGNNRCYFHNFMKY